MTEHPTSGRPSRADYVRALQSMDTFIDVSVDDLITLADQAAQFARQRRTGQLTVGRIMTQPVQCVHVDTRMSEAAQLLISQRISGLPVLDGDDKLIGILTEADFLRALGVPGHHPTHSLWQTMETLLNHLSRHQSPIDPADKVAMHMVRDVVKVLPDRPLDEVLEKMKRHQVKRVVVCDRHDRVVGMMTRSDLVRLFFERYAERGQTGGARQAGSTA